MAVRPWVGIAAVWVLIAALGAGLATGAESGSTTVRFDYTGARQYLAVPTDVTSLDVVACGAAGGITYNPLGLSAPGGLGGRVESTIPRPANGLLNVYVGGSGDGTGWNGGGAGSVSTLFFEYGAAGGGATDVRSDGIGLTNRVVVAGGGGGSGWYVGGPQGVAIAGGAGGGPTGGGSNSYQGSGGTQTAGGTGSGGGADGALGFGGDGAAGQVNAGAGGGGGLYGGGGGGAEDNFASYAGGGGSGLGDVHTPGVCAGDGWAEITFTTGLGPQIRPWHNSALEGDSGTTTMEIPVMLTVPQTVPVTVDWSALLPTSNPTGNPALALAGSDFVADSGVVTFPPGSVLQMVELEVIGDTIDEPGVLYGEWGVVRFSNPSGATIDPSSFYGASLFIIVDDD